MFSPLNYLYLSNRHSLYLVIMESVEWRVLPAKSRHSSMTQKKKNGKKSQDRLYK